MPFADNSVPFEHSPAQWLWLADSSSVGQVPPALSLLRTPRQRYTPPPLSPGKLPARQKGDGMGEVLVEHGGAEDGERGEEAVLHIALLSSSTADTERVTALQRGKPWHRCGHLWCGMAWAKR